MVYVCNYVSVLDIRQYVMLGAVVLPTVSVVKCLGCIVAAWQYHRYSLHHKLLLYSNPAFLMIIAFEKLYSGASKTKSSTVGSSFDRPPLIFHLLEKTPHSRSKSPL